jgi:nucleoid-associated protein YgaU
VTNAELNRRNAQPPVRFVQPGNSRSGDAITPITPASNSNPPITIAERLRQAAELQGEQLVAVNDSNGSNPLNGGNTPANPPRVDPPARQTVRNYVAQPGDSLALIARKVYGSASKANRQAIINANTDLADDPNLIIAGQTYVIPPLAAASAGNNAVAPAPAPKPEKPANENTIVYVVQPHDTLWSIAVNEVGNAGAVAAIRELNQTVLNGTDRVKPNMKLKLPNKS